MPLTRSVVQKFAAPLSLDAAEGDYQQWFPSQPSDVRPTLDGAPDDLPMREAAILHTQASRWLEYLKIELARFEARLKILQQRTKSVTRTVKYKRGSSVDKWEATEVQQVNEAEEAEAEADARVILLKGILDGTEKVRNAASRAITRHEKMNTNEGSRWET